MLMASLLPFSARNRLAVSPENVGIECSRSPTRKVGAEETCTICDRWFIRAADTVQRSRNGRLCRFPQVDDTGPLRGFSQNDD